MRETRDLRRRRTSPVRRRAEALAPLVNANSPDNLPPRAQKLTYAADRHEPGRPARFRDPRARKGVAVDRALIGAYDARRGDRELYPERTAKAGGPQAPARLRSVPGVGKVLAPTLL
jgi:hypothetical protein